MRLLPTYQKLPLRGEKLEQEAVALFGNLRRGGPGFSAQPLTWSAVPTRHPP